MQGLSLSSTACDSPAPLLQQAICEVIDNQQRAPRPAIYPANVHSGAFPGPPCTERTGCQVTSGDSWDLGNLRFVLPRFPHLSLDLRLWALKKHKNKLTP